jgi:hypothetical protein
MDKVRAFRYSGIEMVEMDDMDQKAFAEKMQEYRKIFLAVGQPRF